MGSQDLKSQTKDISVHENTKMCLATQIFISSTAMWNYQQATTAQQTIYRWCVWMWGSQLGTHIRKMFRSPYLRATKMIRLFESAELTTPSVPFWVVTSIPATYSFFGCVGVSCYLVLFFHVLLEPVVNIHTYITIYGTSQVSPSATQKKNKTKNMRQAKSNTWTTNP